MAIQQESLTHPKYRPDIDGLRAIAVLAVVAFHAFPSLVRGGFIGVDIFFVISGYLISTIIFENLEKNTFSFIGFYARRVKRIFPALILVLISCLILGWLLLPSNEFKQLGKHIAAGSSFVSNFALWNEAGYFDNSAETKPLLHLWSLGIEEQFYIVWPVLIWFLYKRKINLLVAIIILTITSFILNLHGVEKDLVATFYSPQTRFWELMSGSLLAWITLQKNDSLLSIKSTIAALLGRVIYSDKQAINVMTLSSALSFVGLFLLIYGIFSLNKELSFPGAWALAPVLGAFILIMVDENSWVNRKILSNRVAVWFGLISFPLYLWHWPLLSIARIVSDTNELSRYVRICIILLSFGLSWVTFKIVENPIRFSNKLNELIKVNTLIFLMLLIFIAGYVVYMYQGLPQRSVNQKQVQSDVMLDYIYSLRDPDRLYGEYGCFKYNENQKVDFFIKNQCLSVKEKNKPVAFLIGDSHSASLSLGLRPLMETLQINLLQASTGWCQPTSNDYKNKICTDINNKVVSTIKETQIDLLIIDSHWVIASKPPYWISSDDYNNYLKEKLRQYLALGVKKILVIGQLPTWDKKDGLPGKISRDFIKKDIPIPLRTYEDVSQASLDIDTVMSQLDYPENVSYVSLKNILCNADGCLITVGDNPKTDLIVWDYGHLTPAGSSFISNKLKNTLKNLLQIEGGLVNSAY